MKNCETFAIKNTRCPTKKRFESLLVLPMLSNCTLLQQFNQVGKVMRYDKHLECYCTSSLPQERPYPSQFHDNNMQGIALYESVAEQRGVASDALWMLKCRRQVKLEVQLSMPLCRILCGLLNRQYTRNTESFLVLEHHNNDENTEVTVKHHTGLHRLERGRETYPGQ